MCTYMDTELEVEVDGSVETQVGQGGVPFMTDAERIIADHQEDPPSLFAIDV